MKSYYIVFQFDENYKRASGFGSVVIDNIDFNPLTIKGIQKLKQLINDNLSDGYLFKRNYDAIILNVIPLEN